MQLSYNKLKTFGECALRYRFAYLERLPRPPIRALAFHRRLHAALADYHRLARRDGVVRVDDLLAAHARLSGADVDPAVRETKAFREGEQVLRLYCERENRLKRVPAYLEHPFRVEFGPHILTGKVDRLDFADEGGYVLLDYKLDRELPADNVAEESRQLSFYDLLVYEALGVAPREVRLYYLRHGVEYAGHRTPPQRLETLTWVEETAARMQEERAWAPCEGEACRACPFWEHCPAKTGQARAPVPVWQQGELWGAETPDESPVASPAPAPLQPSLFLF